MDTQGSLIEGQSHLIPKKPTAARIADEVIKTVAVCCMKVGKLQPGLIYYIMIVDGAYREMADAV